MTHFRADSLRQPRESRAAQARFPKRALAPLLTLALLVCAAGGCINLFKPAEPEAPVVGSGSVEVTLDYSEPATVLATLAEGVQAKGRGNGTLAYMDALADSAADGVPFVVEFAAEVASQWPRGVPVWTRTLEQQFYLYLVGLNPDEYLMQWTSYTGAPSDDADPASSQATLYRQYQVFAVSQDGTSVSVAHGRADLVFQRIRAGRWVITRWVDRVDPAVGADPADAGLRSFSRLRLDSTGR